MQLAPTPNGNNYPLKLTILTLNHPHFKHYCMIVHVGAN